LRFRTFAVGLVDVAIATETVQFDALMTGVPLRKPAVLVEYELSNFAPDPIDVLAGAVTANGCCAATRVASVASVDVAASAASACPALATAAARSASEEVESEATVVVADGAAGVSARLRAELSKVQAVVEVTLAVLVTDVARWFAAVVPDIGTRVRASVAEAIGVGPANMDAMSPDTRIEVAVRRLVPAIRRGGLCGWSVAGWEH